MCYASSVIALQANRAKRAPCERSEPPFGTSIMSGLSFLKVQTLLLLFTQVFHLSVETSHNYTTRTQQDNMPSAHSERKKEIMFFFCRR
jgi:hypothetical protein